MQSPPWTTQQTSPIGTIGIGAQSAGRVGTYQYQGSPGAYSTVGTRRIRAGWRVMQLRQQQQQQAFLQP